MQRIYYASGSILTGDEIARAVLDYAEALAKSPLADVINIPVVNEFTGSKSIATLLVGPSSQLMFVQEDHTTFSEPVEPELVREIVRKTLLVGAPRPVPQDVDERVLIAEDYE